MVTRPNYQEMADFRPNKERPGHYLSVASLIRNLLGVTIANAERPEALAWGLDHSGNPIVRGQ